MTGTRALGQRAPGAVRPQARPGSGRGRLRREEAHLGGAFGRRRCPAGEGVPLIHRLVVRALRVTYCCGKSGREVRVDSEQLNCRCAEGDEGCPDCATHCKTPGQLETRPPEARVVHRRVSETSGEGRYVRLEEASNSPARVGEVQFTRCDLCGIQVKDVERHKQKVHAGACETQSPAPDKSNPTFSLTKCPICHSMVADLAKHVRRAKHDPNGIAALRPRPKLAKISVRQVGSNLECPFCKSEWPNQWQFKSHVAGIHGRAALDVLLLP